MPISKKELTILITWAKGKVIFSKTTFIRVSTGES
jgi:hypothetical protein